MTGAERTASSGRWILPLCVSVATGNGIAGKAPVLRLPIVKSPSAEVGQVPALVAGYPLLLFAKACITACDGGIDLLLGSSGTCFAGDDLPWPWPRHSSDGKLSPSCRPPDTLGRVGDAEAVAAATPDHGPLDG